MIKLSKQYINTIKNKLADKLYKYTLYCIKYNCKNC